MKTKAVLFVFNCIIFSQLTEAHVTHVTRTPIPSPGPMPRPTPPPSSTTTPPPTALLPPPFDRITPKCYPETAKAYFLPAPPSSPKVTILDQNLKELPSSIKSTLQEIKEVPSSIKSTFQEVREIPPSPQTKQALASNMIANRPSFTPPPTPAPMMPDIIDEIPTMTKDNFSRLTDSNVKVCDACANLMTKLPIFKFDQELLDGFLAGLGL